MLTIGLQRIHNRWMGCVHDIKFLQNKTKQTKIGAEEPNIYQSFNIIHPPIRAYIYNNYMMLQIKTHRSK